MRSAQSQKDKFETLCHVKADISSAPYTSTLVETGKMGYTRKYTVILLVGLTELKAQVGWIDSETVRGYLIHSTPIHPSHPISICTNPGGREKVCSNVIRVSPPLAEFNF